MAKTVDIAERTLEKDKKDFILVCKIAEAFSSFLSAICIVGLMAVAIMAIVSVIGVANSELFDSSEAIWNTVINTIMLITMSIALNFSRKIFNKLKTGETPFQYDIADKIKASGITLVIGPFICTILEFISGFFSDMVEVAINIDLNYAIFGVVLIALAYVFNYGCKLQQESDETL